MSIEKYTGTYAVQPCRYKQPGWIEIAATDERPAFKLHKNAGNEDRITLFEEGSNLVILSRNARLGYVGVDIFDLEEIDFELAKEDPSYVFVTTRDWFFTDEEVRMEWPDIFDMNATEAVNMILDLIH